MDAYRSALSAFSLILLVHWGTGVLILQHQDEPPTKDATADTITNQPSPYAPASELEDSPYGTPSIWVPLGESEMQLPWLAASPERDMGELGLLPLIGISVAARLSTCDWKTRVVAISQSPGPDSRVGGIRTRRI